MKGGDYTSTKKEKTYKNLLDFIIQKIDDERKIPGDAPKGNEKKIADYINACNFAIKIFSDGKGKIEVDNPKIPYKYHCVSIDIYDEDFDDDRLHDFADLLDMFDGLSFFGTSSLSIILQMYGLYN